MASQQDVKARDDVRGKEARAEEAAANKLKDVNRQKGVTGADVLVEHHDETRPGIIGSIFQTVTGTLGHAKDAVTGKTHETTEKAAETKETAKEKAGEYKNYAAEKTKGTADATAQRAKEAKEKMGEKVGEYEDYAAQKAKEKTGEKVGEYKDYGAQKAKEAAEAKEKVGEYEDYGAQKAQETKAEKGKDAAVGTMTGLKDSAAGVARKAMDFLSGKKEETNLKGRGDEEEARLKMETMNLKGQGYNAKATTVHTTSPHSRGRSDEEVVGATAEAFRQADQISGQTFNDVGKMDVDQSSKR